MIRQCYLIYTEALNELGTVKIVAQEFSAFTIYKGEGYWHDVSEHSLVIEIIDSPAAAIREKVDKVAIAIKAYLKQEAVMVTEDPVITRLI